MNYREAIEYIESTLWMGSRPGLGRITRIMEMMGNPQDGIRFIHVAGTNGKGSFCAMAESILRAAGYNTGLFVSPHIMRLNERIQAGGAQISDDELADIATYVRSFADNMEDTLTEFELISAIAFEFFRRHSCEVVVLEVGMGGRLDATNIIKNPLLSVVTGIALDHTAYLGDTIEKIAFEKAGIIKPGCPVFWGGRGEAAGRIISARAAELGSDFCAADYTRLNNVVSTLAGSDFDYDEYENLHINLLGLYQPENAASVLGSLALLRARGLDIPERAVRQGLASARWAARFEKLSDNPIVIYDGSHNPEGMEAATRSIGALLEGKKVNVLTGVVRDKDYSAIARLLLPVARRVFTVAPDISRALPASEYANVFRSLGVAVDAYDELSDGARAAYADSLTSSTPLIILGSLYMYSDIRAALGI